MAQFYGFYDGFLGILWVLLIQNGHNVKLWSKFHHFLAQPMTLGQKHCSRDLECDYSENPNFLGVGGQNRPKTG